jgi:tripartite-type tricarboxylate transporter receptor subunit TctC
LQQVLSSRKAPWRNFHYRTPKPVIDTLNKEVNQILATDTMRAWLDKQGMVAVGGTPDDFRRQIEVDYQARGELVRTLGITGE